MGDQFARGEECERKAEKKLSGWGLLSNKYEDAADLYEKAANCFKLAKTCNPSPFLARSFHFLLFPVSIALPDHRKLRIPFYLNA